MVFAPPVVRQGTPKSGAGAEERSVDFGLLAALALDLGGVRPGRGREPRPRPRPGPPATPRTGPHRPAEPTAKPAGPAGFGSPGSAAAQPVRSPVKTHAPSRHHANKVAVRRPSTPAASRSSAAPFRGAQGSGRKAPRRGRSRWRSGRSTGLWQRRSRRSWRPHTCACSRPSSVTWKRRHADRQPGEVGGRVVADGGRPRTLPDAPNQVTSTVLSAAATQPADRTETRPPRQPWRRQQHAPRRSLGAPRRNGEHDAHFWRHERLSGLHQPSTGTTVKSAAGAVRKGAAPTHSQTPRSRAPPARMTTVRTAGIEAFRSDAGVGPIDQAVRRCDS